MGLLSGYLALWDNIWRLIFSGIVGIIDAINRDPSLRPLDFVGTPAHIGTPTGEYGVFLFMTLMLHFIILVALTSRGR